MKIIIPAGGAVKLINANDRPVVVKARGVKIDPEISGKCLEIRPENSKDDSEVIYLKQ